MDLKSHNTSSRKQLTSPKLPIPSAQTPQPTSVPAKTLRHCIYTGWLNWLEVKSHGLQLATLQWSLLDGRWQQSPHFLHMPVIFEAASTSLASLGASRLRALRRMFDHARVSKQGENVFLTNMVHCGKGVSNSSMLQALTGLARRLVGLRLCFWDARLGALDLALPYRSESFLTALILRRPISGLVHC